MTTYKNIFPTALQNNYRAIKFHKRLCKHDFDCVILTSKTGAQTCHTVKFLN